MTSPNPKKNKKNYFIATFAQDIQVLVKKGMVSEMYSIEFLSYADSDKENNYTMQFADVYMRDALYDSIIGTGSAQSIEFIKKVYDKFLNKPSKT